MIIESKIHGFEILKFVYPESSDSTLNAKIKKTQSIYKSHMYFDEEAFWQSITICPDGQKFLMKNKIKSLVELVNYHFEWKIKYMWMIDKRIMPYIDYDENEFEDIHFLD